MVTPTPPPTLDGCATLPEYAARVLGYALRYGCHTLDGEQLRHADSAAQLAACSLPADLDPDQARFNDTLHTLRLEIQREQLTRAAQLARLAAQLAEMTEQTDDPQDLGHDAPEESDTDRAAKLLRAALLLIMGPLDPGTGNGGGRRTPLQPPPNPKPSGTQADSQGTDQRARIAAEQLQQTLQRPSQTTRPGDDIAF